LRQADLRHHFGLVPQNTILFSGSIRDNIAFGKEEASDAEISEALRIAQAADFVNEREEGLDAVLSQGGKNLSGGQKQRLSIARALVRRPAFYLFDDSFSALDFKTDRQLRQELKKVTADAGVLIVAQRISTILDADRIIVLEQGEITGQGTHAELLKSNRVYREIVSSQLGEEALV
ncbi:MAG: ABC transporter ATP-binding protein, partial [Bacillota bacterium]|nr:ABC transporter ATP-binding protein [Bacillota bacterium]